MNIKEQISIYKQYHNELRESIKAYLRSVIEPNIAISLPLDNQYQIRMDYSDKYEWNFIQCVRHENTHIQIYFNGKWRYVDDMEINSLIRLYEQVNKKLNIQD